MPASAAMPEAPRTPAASSEAKDPDARSIFIERFGVRLAIVVLGVAAATGVILTDDQDPIVFAIPVLVATTIIVGLLTLAGSETRSVQRAGRETGLDYDGVRPVPPITGLLRDDHGPAPMLSGDLDAYGPEVRVAFLRRRLVALVDLSEQPSGAHADLGDAARAYLADHPLQAEAELEDETLVLSVPRDTPPKQLLDLARAVVARL